MRAPKIKVKSMTDKALDIKGPDKPAEPVIPRCQYCGVEPAPMMLQPMRTPAGPAFLAICGNPSCRALFGIQIMMVVNGGQAPEPQPEPIPN